MLKIDLHTHSILSHDGGISLKGYQQIIKKKVLDYIAITDHNQIEFAQIARKKLGPQIIVGEEILTQDGEIIGLFLKQKIKAHQPLKNTIAQIKKQKGLVYIPHPLETWRHGVGLGLVSKHTESIDIIEIFNARSLVSQRKMLQKFSCSNNLSFASSSDAHCQLGIGSAYSFVKNPPNSKNLTNQLKNGRLSATKATPVSLLCPTLNKLKKKLFYGR